MTRPLTSDSLATRLRRVAAVPLVALLALAFGAPAAFALPADPSDALYDPLAVSVADITLPQSSIDALNGDPSVYRPGTLTMTVAGTRHATMPVEVRLKGHGSFQPLSGKASFKLKLGKKLLGLKKMTLNNMAQDPSRVHESLAYSLYRAAGVPASRSGYTFVTLNGEDYGLYSNIETYDEVALEKLFGETKHLYEGSYDAGFGADVLPGHETAYEVDEGDANDRSDLSALIGATGRNDGAFSTNVAPVADLEEMTRMWAVESYTGDWDSYSVTNGNPLLPNNYYLHNGPDGIFRMLPSGTDLAFTARTPIGAGDASLISRCRADSECKARFDAQVASVRDLATSTDWDTMLSQTSAVLAPYVARDTRSGISADAVAAGVQSAREFLAARPADVDAYFNPPVPPVDPDPVTPAPVVPADAAAPKPQCVVPRLSGATLAQARRRLAKSHCSLGKVTRSPRAGGRPQLVSAFSPAAGKRRPGGSKVAITLKAKKPGNSRAGAAARR